MDDGTVQGVSGILGISRICILKEANPSGLPVVTVYYFCSSFNPKCLPSVPSCGLKHNHIAAVLILEVTAPQSLTLCKNPEACRQAAD